MSIPSIVVGIDVGGPRKGFHALALREGAYLDAFAARDAASMAHWCHRVDAGAVAIDAPCSWSMTGRARAAERQLAAEGISAFATPTRERAEGRPFYAWMMNGAALYDALVSSYPLFDGRNDGSAPVCFETYPQAVACALARTIVSAKRKRSVRRDLLREAGIDIVRLSNIDMVDAALCAVTARHFVDGRVKAYGEATDGFIVVPAGMAADSDGGPCATGS